MFGWVLEEIIRGFQFRACHYFVSALSSFRAGQSSLYSEPFFIILLR